jgi:hypothetical protein
LALLKIGSRKFCHEIGRHGNYWAKVELICIGLSRKGRMLVMIFAILTLAAFSLSCHQLTQSLFKRIPIFETGPYSRSALRVKKAYSIFAWCVMTSIFLAAMIHSFIAVYSDL